MRKRAGAREGTRAALRPPASQMLPGKCGSTTTRNTSHNNESSPQIHRQAMQKQLTQERESRPAGRQDKASTAAGGQRGTRAGRGLSVPGQSRNTAFSPGPGDTADYCRNGMGPRHPHPPLAARGKRGPQGSIRSNSIQGALLPRHPCTRRGRGHRGGTTAGEQGAAAVT